MLHYIKWKLQIFWKNKFITNDLFGIQVNYLGKKDQWEYFIYPYLDDNKKSIFYFAFDNVEQKSIFENTLKINWIWPKTAFQIVQLPKEKLQTAIKNLDAKFFQTIPWIWPKSAKKILLEMKWNFDLGDLEKLDIDQQLYKDIVKSLKWFWYDSDKIKNTLKKYEGKISKENMWEVIKRIIKQI
jgi:Holliday junction resolvasome RuvABC DNA-binding subunit